MGNRAVITRSLDDNAPAIYLHWNGGRDSVEGFLKVAQYLAFQNDTAEDWDEFAEFLSTNFFNDRSIYHYRETYGRSDSDNGDNGTYVVDENWNITSRHFNENQEQWNIDSFELCSYILNKHLGYDDETAEKMTKAELAA